MKHSNLPCKDALVNFITKFKMHLSVLKIKSVFSSIMLSDFNFASSDDISNIITLLDSTKKTSEHKKMLNSQTNILKKRIY